MAPNNRPNLKFVYLEDELNVMEKKEAAVAKVGLLGNGRTLLGHFLLAKVQGQLLLVNVLKLEVESERTGVYLVQEVGLINCEPSGITLHQLSCFP